MHDCVTVEEGATARIFTGQTNRNAFVNQRRVSQRFRAAPVEQLLACRHGLTVSINFRHARLHLDSVRHGADAFSQLLQALHLHLVRIALIPLVVEVRRPGKGVHVHRAQLFHYAFTRVQRVAVEVDHFGRIFQRRHFVAFQLVSIDFARRRVFFDFLVHQRLGCTWLIRFVVAVTAVAEEVNEHIAFEGVTEVQRQTGHESHGFRVIRVNVEDRRLHHLTDVGAVRGRTCVQRVRGGEAHLVVDHDANGTAHFVTTRFGHVQGFLHHALPCHRRITVDGDWQNFVAARLVQTIQTRAHGTDNHRADDFQV